MRDCSVTRFSRLMIFFIATVKAPRALPLKGSRGEIRRWDGERRWGSAILIRVFKAVLKPQASRHIVRPADHSLILIEFTKTIHRQSSSRVTGITMDHPKRGGDIGGGGECDRWRGGIIKRFRLSLSLSLRSYFPLDHRAKSYMTITLEKITLKSELAALIICVQSSARPVMT